MMQFSDVLPPITHKISPLPTLLMNKNNQIIHHTSRPWPSFPTSKTLTTGNFGDANCMEQLLVHCANAIQNNDATLAQQILWVLNNTVLPDGDSNQRLTCAFLRALIARAAKTGNSKLVTAMAANAHASSPLHTHKFSIIELTSFVDLTPWHRFGFNAANAALLEAVEGYPVIHIVDLSSTHCMQFPTLIDAIANRFDTPPVVKLTVAGTTVDYPPILDLSYDELGAKLVHFARTRNINMEFRVIPSNSCNGFTSLIEHLEIHNQHSAARVLHGEALIINCHMMLHYIPEETLPECSSIHPNSSLRSMFLKAVRSLDPTLLILADEDADFTSSNLVCRLRSAYNYLWIPYDTVDTFLPRGSKQRQWYEADICWKIENVIAHEGVHRVERLEPRSKWAQRLRNAGFRGVPFGEEAVSEVKNMLDEHAAGWGLKREEEDLVLTWKGHNVVFATAWAPY